MMLALLGTATNGVFSSRRIERATYRDLGVRYLTADGHPDHDTICAFRRRNMEAVAEAFTEVLLLARELRLLRVGTVSVDGTKVDANANKRNSVRYDRAEALREQLRGEIDGLLAEAERADAEAAPDAQSLPQELSRRDKLAAKLDKACAELERRAKRRAAAERGAYERKVAARESREGSSKGRHIKPPDERPGPAEQINLTDADSGLMRKSKRHEYRQAYNAQAGGGRGWQPAGAGRAGEHERERPAGAGGGRGQRARGAGRGGTGAGRQRLRDGRRGRGAGGPRDGRAGGDRCGRHPPAPRLPAGVEAAAAGAEGGVAQGV